MIGKANVRIGSVVVRHTEMFLSKIQVWWSWRPAEHNTRVVMARFFDTGGDTANGRKKKIQKIESKCNNSKEKSIQPTKTLPRAYHHRQQKAKVRQKHHSLVRV